MYVEIKENKLLSWCKAPYLDYEYVNIDHDSFDISKYKVIAGVLTDITATQEYKDWALEVEKEKTLIDLKSQIEELDKKRVRAIAEPQLKDGASGQTWLEYYTSQIQDLRRQIATL